MNFGNRSLRNLGIAYGEMKCWFLLYQHWENNGRKLERTFKKISDPFKREEILVVRSLKGAVMEGGSCCHLRYSLSRCT